MKTSLFVTFLAMKKVSRNLCLRSLDFVPEASGSVIGISHRGYNRRLRFSKSTMFKFKLAKNEKDRRSIPTVFSLFFNSVNQLLSQLFCSFVFLQVYRLLLLACLFHNLLLLNALSQRLSIANKLQQLLHD